MELEILETSTERTACNGSGLSIPIHKPASTFSPLADKGREGHESFSQFSSCSFCCSGRCFRFQVERFHAFLFICTFYFPPTSFYLPIKVVDGYL